MHNDSSQRSITSTDLSIRAQRNNNTELSLISLNVRLERLERSRLGRKAKALLNRQGDRPLRNQQKRLINRYQAIEASLKRLEAA